MGYTDVDKLAISAIRILAVGCSVLLFSSSHLPLHRGQELCLLTAVATNAHHEGIASNGIAQ